MRFSFGYALEVIEWVELALLALCLAVAFTNPRFGDATFSAGERKLAAFARRRWMPLVIAAILPVSLRVVALFSDGTPQALVSEEYGMLLEAETFLHGRVANSTPPLWRHFETIYVLMHPSYASQYPPGQPAFLALGRLLFGHPWAGVLLGMGLFSCALVWALRAWLPPTWAFTGGCVAGLHLLGSYWMDSYFGGGVGALGGALVFGAMPRLREAHPIRNSLLAGLGLALVLTTRPYEFICLVAFVSIWILWRVARLSDRPKMLPLLLPGSALAIAAGLFMSYQNAKVTANLFRLPYLEMTRQYGITQPLVFSRAVFVPVPVREIEVEERFQIGLHNRIRTVRGFVENEISSVRTVWRVLIGFLLLPPLVFCWLGRRSEGFRTAAGAIAVFVLAHALYGYYFAHYDAPIAAAWMLLVMLGWRRLRAWSPSGRSVGLALSRLLILAVAISPWLIYAARAAGSLRPQMQTWNQKVAQEFHDSSARTRLESCLAERFSGQQLVIVRYSPDHDVNDEWVYNSADLTDQRVLWARSRASRKPGPHGILSQPPRVVGRARSASASRDFAERTGQPDLLGEARSRLTWSLKRHDPDDIPAFPG